MPASGSERPRRRGVVALRTVGFIIALACGAVAVWLIVTSTSQKRIEIGILTGLWGLLIGTYAMFGSRSSAREPVAPPAPPSQEIDLRKVGEIERAAVAAARREFQAELVEMLHREVQAGVAAELSELRADVAALRNELVEKVGGQLRLERIETTRLIGSDLEALQHELRQLRQIGGLDGDDHGHIVVERVSPTHVTEPLGALAPEPVAPVEPELAPEPVVTAEPESAAHQPEPAATAEPEPVAQQPEPEPVVTAEPEPVAHQPEPEPVVTAEPEPVAHQPEPEPVVTAEPEPVARQPEPAARQPEPEPAALRAPPPAPRPEPTPSASTDPLAGLPRLSPFRDIDLSAPVAPAARVRPAGHRHAADDDEPTTSGRRHRADDSDNDVLARILARERH